MLVLGAPKFPTHGIQLITVLITENRRETPALQGGNESDNRDANHELLIVG